MAEESVAPKGLLPDTASTDLEQAIADLIESSTVDIKLSPDGLEEILSAEEVEIEGPDVVAALSAIAPDETFLASSEGEEIWEGATQTFTARLHHATRLVDIGTTEERQIEETETDGVDDAGVEWLLRDYLVALGAREQEIGPVDVRAFLSQARGEEDDYVGPITMVGKAAFTTRELGGIPVFGNRLHVTVTPQGDLDRVKGRWTPIDYAHSVLAVDISEDDVISLAVSALADVGINVEPSPRIVITTAYRIVNDKTYGEIVVLRGFATAIYDAEPGFGDYEASSDASRTVEFDLL